MIVLYTLHLEHVKHCKRTNNQTHYFQISLEWCAETQSSNDLACTRYCMYHSILHMQILIWCIKYVLHQIPEMPG